MSNRDNHPSRRRPIAVRALATILAAVLAFAVLAPALARAEAESEGEGSAQPGAPIPGLEEGATFEPDGEETSLEEVPTAGGEEEAEAEPSFEAEPPLAPEVPVPAPPVRTEPTPVPAEPTPPVGEAPPAATAGPVYGTAEEAAPSYEAAAPTAPVEPVRNEAIVALSSPSEKMPGPVRPVHQKVAGPREEPAPAPAEAPEPAAPSSTPPAVPVDRAGGLAGRPFHTVAAGECLWSIAERVLPAGASDAEIAAEVSRLWHLNATRIGTGDPSLILVGTVLRLH